MEVCGEIMSRLDDVVIAHQQNTQLFADDVTKQALA